ncbi:MAG: tetratricopeptide repeat protein, partial [Deltaproteobacteria bacterium]|nr:tetratricopeptide repeat protein [Deltaproteobacteria bacterium]
LLASALLLGGPAACLGTAGGADDPTVDRILRQLDETSRQRTADARRLEDLSRRIAVLETLLQAERERPAAEGTALPATPPPGAPAASGTSATPTPPLPVVHLTPPPASGEPVETLALAQGAATRAAPDIAVAEPARDEPANELSDIPYQGVGFGNDGGDGYLRVGAPDAGTIRLVGTPRTTPGAPETTPVPPPAPGGTPSAAFGAVPRIPPMVPGPPTAVATPETAAASAVPAYEAGVEAYRDRRWQEAIGWFERARVQGLGEPKAALALFFQAEATFQTRAYLDAVGLFERFVGRHPDHARAAEALLRIGTASERLGDVERAAELYHRIVAEHPASAAAATAATRLEAAGTEGRQP